MLDLNAIRAQFPAFEKRPAIYFDNPAGTQVARQSADRMLGYLLDTNSNKGGAFALSRESDAVLDEARQAAADFLGAGRKEEIVFGPNMTSLTLHLSRSLAHTLNPGDRVLVTRLDHDANISPWTRVAEERGAEVVWVDFDVEDGTLNADSLRAALDRAPKLAAIGYASNALGTINPVKDIIRQARAAGVETIFIDAVQYAPHGPIDVQDLGCDFLACSAYKFFGPHLGLLYGRYDLLDGLTAYKVRPASNKPPYKWETGTGNHEGIAGMLGALEYLGWLGETYGAAQEAQLAERYSGRGLQLRKGLAALRAYEFELSRAMLDMLTSLPKVRLYGLADPRRIEERVPTFSINIEGMRPHDVAVELDRRGIYAWDGNYYALAVTQRLGVEDSGGMVRLGPVHYNTMDEVHKVGEALAEISG
ncbi:MAG: cysteine desulfurase-like protein [Anaerolineae bacterium]|nr:MAG: cysteine desulfurase-like protein [Anaerolineae bacterium]